MSSNVTRNNLGLSSRTDQDFRLVGQQLLLRGLGVLDRRSDVGNVESHITSETIWLIRPERPDQQETLQLEIWARPTGFMKR
jgi:hypothetical protein